MDSNLLSSLFKMFDCFISPFIPKEVTFLSLKVFYLKEIIMTQGCLICGRQSPGYPFSNHRKLFPVPLKSFYFRHCMSLLQLKTDICVHL